LEYDSYTKTNDARRDVRRRRRIEVKGRSIEEIDAALARPAASG